MKNKLSWFAVPYVVWMALFVVAPIIMVVIYAFSTADGGFTLDNFTRMGTYAVVFSRSFKLAIIATAVCLLIGYPISYLMSQGGPPVSAGGHGSHHAAHVDELSAADLLLDVHSGEQRPFEPVVPEHWAHRSLQPDRHGTLPPIRRPMSPLPIFSCINTQGAVVLGMVYNYLPFMILPIYSVIVKLDHSLIEAARDLGRQHLPGVPAGDPAA